MESVECGAAALGMVLAYYGRWVPLMELRSECGVSRDGSRASNIVLAARRYGLIAKGYKRELHEVFKLQGPFIVFWHFNHFLVVDGFSRDGVHVNDPAEGPRVIPYEDFDEGFSGVVLVLRPGPDFEKGGDKPDPVRGLLDRVRGTESSLVFCIVAGLLLVIPGLITPLFVKVFVDNILVREMHDWLVPLLAGMAITGVARGLLRYFQLRSLRRLNLKLSTTMTGKFLWHVLHLPVDFFAHRFAGEVANRTALNTSLATIVSRHIALLAIDAIVVVFYGIVLVLLDPLLGLLGIVSALLELVLVRLSLPRSNANLKLSMETGKAAGVAIAGLDNIETIKASGLEGDFFSRWAGYYAKAMNAHREVALRNAVVGVGPPLLAALTQMGVLILGGQRVLEGHLTIGTLVAVQSIMASFLGPIARLVGVGNLVREVGANLTRIGDLIQHPLDPETDRAAGFRGLDAGSVKLRGFVELEDVTFGYSPLDPPLIEGFNLGIKPGQRVALVGGSGSGKSTIAKLVAGLYQPWHGELRFDGVRRDRIPREVLTNSIAVVEQDIFMFRGTVRENLGLWDYSVPDDLLVRACSDAEIYDTILGLPGGFDALLIDGAGNLSGGQRQRLEIARALLADPSILILDEASSALDAQTEQKIGQNLRKRGCTCIVVAHRLSTIRDCDEIILLERGKVVQRGTHESLKDIDGQYRRLLEAEGALQEDSLAAEAW